jgi:hypothetical protein
MVKIEWQHELKTQVDSKRPRQDKDGNGVRKRLKE